MQTHNLKRKTPNKKSRQHGRGGTRGKTAGRGTKGQNARAGHKKRPEIRDFIKRLPKLRGRGKNSNLTIETKASVVNLEAINKAFKVGDVVSPQTLVKSGLVNKTSGNLPRVKVLATGTIDKAFKFKNCSLSLTAKAAIEKAGGSIVA